MARRAEPVQRPQLTDEMAVRINYYDIKGKLHENEGVVTGFDEAGRLRVFRERDNYEFRAREVVDMAREAREGGASTRVADFRPISVTIEEERVARMHAVPLSVTTYHSYGFGEPAPFTQTYTIVCESERRPNTIAEVMRSNIISVTDQEGNPVNAATFIAGVRDMQRRAEGRRES